MAIEPGFDLEYDTETALRLVRGAISDFNVSDGHEPDDRERTRVPAPVERVTLPADIKREIFSVLHGLRASMWLLDGASAGKLRRTNETLLEVSSATETAANGMLDGLDRALALVDDLDAEPQSEEVRPSDTRTKLREEIFGVMDHLQFQDITSQQLRYASSVLVEVERRLAGLAEAIGTKPGSVSETEDGSNRAGDEKPPRRDFDPDASLANAGMRQAVADDVFSSGPRAGIG